MDFPCVETELVVECDVCGWAYCGSGLSLFVKHVGNSNVCFRCWQSDQSLRQSLSGVRGNSVDPWHTLTVGKRAA